MMKCLLHAFVWTCILSLGRACGNDRIHHHHHHHDHNDNDIVRQQQSNFVTNRNNTTTITSTIRTRALQKDGDEHSFRIGSHIWPSFQVFQESGARCGQPSPNEQEVEVNTNKILNWLKHRNHDHSRFLRTGILDHFAKDSDSDFDFDEQLNDDDDKIIQISTYFHVITDGSIGQFAQDLIPAQLDVLNKAFEPYGVFEFVNSGVTVTDNATWYRIDNTNSPAEKEMKSTLRIGNNAETLNVYILDPANGSGGWAPYPWWMEGDWSEEFGINNDGIVLMNWNMPGAVDVNGPYNSGKGLVHEVGHWLGLYHTFFSNHHCWDRGDMLVDTPPQRDATYGCPEGRNSCWFRRGRDPIHNYMDYSDDACKTEFTKMQVIRMKANWDIYRKQQS